MRTWSRQWTCYSRLSLQKRLSSSTPASRIADVLSKHARAEQPEHITVNGFVKTVRKQKKIAFAAIGDGSSFESLQAVMSPQQAEQLSTGAAVTLSGEHRPSVAGAQQSSELHVSAINLLGSNDAAASPLQKKYHSPDFLRTIPHLRWRSPANALLLRLRSHVIAHATRYFEEKGYYQTHTPMITSSDCEGAGEVFQVTSNAPSSASPAAADQDTPFFGAPKYLTVSSQLHLEALAQSVGQVWTLSPTFRAEQSDTARHLSEFYMLEAEASFITDLSQVMDLVEGLVRALASSLAESKLGTELREAEAYAHAQDKPADDVMPVSARWQGLLRPSWPRITYHEAVRVLREAAAQGGSSFADPVDELGGLTTEHEKYIAASIGKGSPVFVTDYPAAIKPFYMAPSTEDGGERGAVPTVACFDLLMPDVCEVAGGSMREHRLAHLEARMQAKGLLEEGYESGAGKHALDWYLDLRRYGSVPHGGFGLGFDRLLAYLAGVHNIRDIVAFPRWYGRSTC